jgi:hypothetical protein
MDVDVDVDADEDDPEDSGVDMGEDLDDNAAVVDLVFWAGPITCSKQ